MDMKPQEIRIELLKAKVSQAAIARKLNVTPPAVRHVIDNISASDRIRRCIAEAIGLDVKRIWPSIYLKGGGPRKRGRPKGPGFCQSMKPRNVKPWQKK